MVDESTKPKLGIVEPETNDPFDLAKLRVSQDFLEQTPTKKLLTTIPVRKPGRQDFRRFDAIDRSFLRRLGFDDLQCDAPTTDRSVSSAA